MKAPNPTTQPDGGGVVEDSLAPPTDRVMTRTTSMVIVATVAAANASNYAFQLVTGRFLGAEAYGLLAGLMTVVSIIGVVAGTFQTIAARAVSAGDVSSSSSNDRLLHTAVRLGIGA